MIPLEEFKKLEGFKQYRGYALACCPEHDDSNPSLRWRNGYVDCYGCGADWRQLEKAILDVGSGNGGGRNGRNSVAHRRPRVQIIAGPGHTSLDWLANYCNLPTDFLMTQPLRFQAKQVGFVFEDSSVVKWRGAPPAHAGGRGGDKEKGDGKGWVWTSEGDDPPPLWPSPASELPSEIWITAGETDCLCLRGSGLPAYALTGGEGKPLTEAQFAALADRGVEHIRYVADVDRAGRSKLEEQQAHAMAAGIILRSLDLSGALEIIRGEKDVRALCRRVGPEALRRTVRDLPEVGSIEERFVRADLGEVVRQGVPKRKMLFEGFIYKGVGHTLHGPSGVGKTMIALALCAQLVKRGIKVFYLDEENGENEIAKRLMGLGLTADELDEFVLCLALTEPSLKEADALIRRITEFEPEFGVFDSGADFYVAAQLDENSSTDMVRWSKAFTQRLSREFGIATLLLEHENADGNEGRPRGSTSKGQKTDVSWHVRTMRKFSQTTTGEVEFLQTKDRFGLLPEIRRATIGGGNKGRVYFELDDPKETKQQREELNQTSSKILWSNIEKVLSQAEALDIETGITQRKLGDLLPVQGNMRRRMEQIKECADSPLNRVRRAYRKGGAGGGSIVYWLGEVGE